MSRISILVLMSLVTISAFTAYGAYTQDTAANIGQMTSDTVKSAPDGTTPDTRTTIGLGEQVVCSINSGTWSDSDCNQATGRLESDTIGDRVWAASTGGEISPSGVTQADSTTLTAGNDPDTCVVLVHVYDSEEKFTDPCVERTKTFTIIKPTGETTVFDSWNSTYPQIAGFEATLTPTSANFTNISVIEQDGTGSADNCWFAGSTYAKWENLTSGTWGVRDDNKWGNDWLGWYDSRITYYRNNPTGDPSAPCATNLAQEMHVIEGSSGEYTDGTMIITIGTTTVKSERDGASQEKTYSP
jgi:hypothetical protein